MWWKRKLLLLYHAMSQYHVNHLTPEVTAELKGLPGDASLCLLAFVTVI